jgi:hypothetical protein
MIRDERFNELIRQTDNAQVWILDRPHSAVTLGDVFRLCGAVKLLLDYVAEKRKADDAAKE